MGFLTRKPVATADRDETRSRNRLSKPMMNNSLVNSSRTTLGKHSPTTSSRDFSTSQLSLNEHVRRLSRQESRTQIETRPVQMEHEDNTTTAANRPAKRGGVASLVMQFESAASTSQSSLVSPLPSEGPFTPAQGPKSQNGTNQSHQLHNARSRDQLRLRQRSTSTLGLASLSTEELNHEFAIPRRRESKYRPGEATRRPSMQELENRKAEEMQKTLEDDQSTIKDYKGSLMAEESEETWSPPPHIPRTETPVSLELKTIGKLRLGSLHIVNGRSSPVLGELSRTLISKQLRDVSSEYADSEHDKESVSETWEDAEVAEEIESNGPPTPTRLADTFDVSGPSTPNRPAPSTLSRFQTPAQSPDKTSMLAEAYMQELRGSPFSFDNSSPASTGSVVHHHEHEEEEKFGSAAAMDDTVSKQRNASSESKPGSIDSGTSSMQTIKNNRDIFSSALEYQAPTFEAPPSPERRVSPEHIRPESVSKASEKADSGYHSGTSMLSLNLSEVRPSGLQLTEPLKPATPQAKTDNAINEKQPSTPSPVKAGSPKKLGGFLPLRPAIKKSPVTSPVVTTTSSFNFDSPDGNKSLPSPAKSDISPKKAKKDKAKEEKKVKSPKKLQKSRPSSRARESKDIVVQRVPSWDSVADVPPVSDTIKANLQRRSRQLPELERTFRSHDHIKSQPSISTLAIPQSEVKFPSPRPSTEVEERQSRLTKKTRDRPRSKSRRRSFLDIFRSDKDSDKRQADVSREETSLSIADFGDVMESLGANPYDIAHSRPQSPEFFSKRVSGPKTNPHDITVSRQRKRSSMNDEQASDFARRRSVSLNRADDKTTRRLSFDDREGMPSKNLRASLVADDAPPMPPLPTKEELRRISLRQSLPSSQANTPSQVRQFWDTNESDRAPESSPAPPPPAHSPLPSFIDQEYEEHYYVDEEFDLAPPPPSHSPAPVEVAPPPPSHSPRPMDLEPGFRNENAWEAQAQAWKARRRSAGEALRSHRYSSDVRDTGYVGEMVGHNYSEESYYPVISPTQLPRPHWSPEAQQYGYYGPVQQIPRSQTWNEHTEAHYDHGHGNFSRPSPNSRPQVRRNHTWDDSQEYIPNNNSSHSIRRPGHDSRQSNRFSRNSNDSRQSFYSHNNCPIDRPFDPPPHLSEDSEEEYGYEDDYPTQQSPSFRGRDRQREYHPDNNGYHGSNDYYGQQPYQQDHHYEQPYYDEYGWSIPQAYAFEHHHDAQPFPDHVLGPLPARPRPNSLAPPPHPPSRPVSQQSHHSRFSMRSNGSAVSLADELHPEINDRPSAAPEFGRYSGGMGYGYEGRQKGFGGSAGTRTVSGKADASWKGKELRGSFGVDLGDVPVIGLVQKVRA